MIIYLLYLDTYVGSIGIAFLYAHTYSYTRVRTYTHTNPKVLLYPKIFK